MDPRNGEILALAAYPSLNPNEYEPWLVQEDGLEPVITPAVGAMFEPGSTFKVITMASALDAGVVEPGSEFLDTGEIEVGGNVIRNWDGEAWGPQTMLGCMEHSLNVCLAWVASEKLGASTLYSYLKRVWHWSPDGNRPSRRDRRPIAHPPPPGLDRVGSGNKLLRARGFDDAGAADGCGCSGGQRRGHGSAAHRSPNRRSLAAHIRRRQSCSAVL